MQSLLSLFACLMVLSCVFQGNGLTIFRASPEETGIYACYMDNYVRPVVSYKFSVQVEGKQLNGQEFQAYQY